MESTNPSTLVVDAHVHPFLLEALQNPRHRLTILRMELDIQMFLRNSDRLEFKFQYFPTSYLRLAAHRVAQHYGLHTMVQDNFMDGQGMRIVVKKTAESIYPRFCLSDVPIKQSENDSTGRKKIVIQSRPRIASSNDNSDGLRKHYSIKSVEVRKQEYDRARARIFSGSSSPESEVVSLKHQNNVNSTGIEHEESRNDVTDMESNVTNTSSRVAILRDREKDLIDPDYDRSYQRYNRNLPNGQNFGQTQLHMQSFQPPPYLQYDTALPQFGHMPNTEASTSYCYSGLVQIPYYASRPYQSSTDAVYVQVPSTAMICEQSYDQLRNAVLQAPICQQPLSFDYNYY